MFNLNEKYFSISERCGRNHQNKFCLRPLKWTNVPGELTFQSDKKPTSNLEMGNNKVSKEIWIGSLTQKSSNSAQISTDAALQMFGVKRKSDQ